MPIGWIIIPIFLLIALLALDVYVVCRIYKKNTQALDFYDKAIKIQPKRGRFLVSWVILNLVILIPVFLVLWVLQMEKEVFYISLCLVPILLPINFFITYPYYTLIKSGAILNGPTLWGWMWRRTEIDISEIDREKVLQRNVGRMLGMTVFKSVNGTKILSLGLDDLQIKEILDSSHEVER